MRCMGFSNDLGKKCCSTLTVVELNYILHLCDVAFVKLLNTGTTCPRKVEGRKNK